MSREKNYRSIIENYVQAYNSFDVPGMLKDLHEEIVFENVSNGEVGLVKNGIDEFKQQAESALEYFSKRNQKITTWAFEGDRVIIEVDYHAVLASDLPNGMKAGDELELRGKSIFEFKEGKISLIRDES